MWQCELHPPHVINVATLPCESQNTENVILQRDITKQNSIKCIIALSKWTRVILCFTLTYLGCYTAKRVWNKDSWHRQPAKTLDANFFLTLTGTSSMLAWPSEIMRACWWWTLWTHVLTWMLIYKIHQNILWNCQCNLMHVRDIF